MTQGAVASPRASASKIAKWLVDKGRVDDAVSILSAWAASGPNDADGQKLLAGALRINPASPLAKAAFARMEGLDGDFAQLVLDCDQEIAIDHFTGHPGYADLVKSRQN